MFKIQRYSSYFYGRIWTYSWELYLVYSDCSVWCRYENSCSIFPPFFHKRLTEVWAFWQSLIRVLFETVLGEWPSPWDAASHVTHVSVSVLSRQGHSSARPRSARSQPPCLCKYFTRSVKRRLTTGRGQGGHVDPTGVLCRQRGRHQAG